MHSFEEQERKLEEELKKVADMHLHVDTMPSRPQYRAAPLVPLSPLGIIG